MQRTRAFHYGTAHEVQGALLAAATADSSPPFNFFALLLAHEYGSTA